MEQIQTATILILTISNAVILVVMIASRHETSYWKNNSDGERELRIEMKNRLDASVAKLGKQNRLIRAMSLSNGFEDPIVDEDDE